MARIKSKKHWEQQSTADIRYQIQAEQGSFEIRNPRSATSLFIEMLQGILHKRGENGVGENTCTGGSKERGRRGRSF